jgi:tetratricopeptide repeat protein
MLRAASASQARSGDSCTQRANSEEKSLPVQVQKSCHPHGQTGRMKKSDAFTRQARVDGPSSCGGYLFECVRPVVAHALQGPERVTRWRLPPQASQQTRDHDVLIRLGPRRQHGPRGWRFPGELSPRRIFGPDHPETLGTHRNLARWLGEAGRVDEAVAQLQALLIDQQRVFGPDHPVVRDTRQNLARFLDKVSSVREADGTSGTSG